MNITGLREIFSANRVNEDAYSLDEGEGNETHVLQREAGQWLVFYSERGLRTSLATHATESAACADLMRRVLDDGTTRKR